MSSLYYIYVILLAVTLAFIVFVSFAFKYLLKRRRAAERLVIQLESISGIFVSVHKLDLERNTIEEVKSLPFVRERIRVAEQSSSSCQETLEVVMKALTQDDFWADMEKFIDFSTLDMRVGGSNTVSLEYRGIRGWMKARFIVLERKNDVISSVLWLIENIDEEKRKQSELRYLSETDLMTGIKNRGCGEKLIKEELRNGSYGMFCMMDADRFKSINDTYGHDVGDSVIKAIANCMKDSFRTTDIVLRLGGDEFAAYVAGVEDESQSKPVIDRLMAAIDQVSIPSLGDRKIEVSIGASFMTPGCGKNFESLYKEADKAVYLSKKNPGTCVTYYSADADSDLDSDEPNQDHE